MRKKNPIIPVVNFFETAPLDAAKTALDVAYEIVRRRTPKALTAPAQPGKRAARKAAAAPLPGTQTEVGS